MKTQSLVRRATPFVGIAAVFAVAAATGAAELLAFPLFLVVVISSALFDDRAQLLTVGAAASLAVLILSVIHLGPTSNLATAVFEVAVLAIVAGSVHEVVRHVRAAEGSAERKAVELESDDARLHMVMEAATIGLGVVAHDGRWLQANERLAAILGRGKGELTQVGLLDVTAAGDRHAVEDALGQLSRGEIVRWESEVQQTSPHGRPIPVSLAIAALSDQSNEPLLVQVTDISARKRLDAMRDALVAVRQVIVTRTAGIREGRRYSAASAPTSTGTSPSTGASTPKNTFFTCGARGAETTPTSGTSTTRLETSPSRQAAAWSAGSGSRESHPPSTTWRRTTTSRQARSAASGCGQRSLFRSSAADRPSG